MTIAAGFFCRDGVVLSTDTEITNSISKTHEAKVNLFDFPGGKVAFALAGNMNFAMGALHKLERKLKRKRTGDPLAEIEKILGSEYQRQFLAHPDHSYNHDLNYFFLMAIWLPPDRTRLYMIDGGSVVPINSRKAIGMGQFVADFIFNQGLTPTDILTALKTSSYALSSIKDSVVGCGGASVHVVADNQGEFGLVTSEVDGPCKELQNYAKSFDFVNSRLLVQMMNEDATDDQIYQYMTETFAPSILKARSRWTISRRKREAGISELNTHLTGDQVKQLVRRLSMGFGPTPPSPVATEASDVRKRSRH